jgi:NAD(P)-dependent dehydrogenase (short-subunit alcohol dehydrogenase family)
MTLEGKVAIVTGGNSGIGKAVALGLGGIMHSSPGF